MYKLMIALLGPALLLLASAAPAMAQSPDIAVEDAWARATVTASQPGAVFFVIRNAGEADDMLTGAASPVADAVEIHESGMQDGVMAMRRLDSVPVAAGGEADFAPGGLHVMLIGLHEPLTKGESFPLELEFATAGRMAVEVTVRDAMAEGTAKQGEHSMHDHH